jgi:hypothetical protein
VEKLVASDSSDQNDRRWPSPQVTVAIGTYRRVTSFVIVSQRSGTKVTGNLETHRKACKAAQTHTALAGWWGLPFGIIWTIAALTSNSKMLKSVEALLTSGTRKAAWLADPSGKFEERYWDGEQWTDQVRSATSDSPPQ